MSNKFTEAAKTREERLQSVMREQGHFEGTYIITLADIVTEEAKEWERQIVAARGRDDMKTVKGFMDMLNNKYGQKPVVVHNVVPNVGRGVLISRLTNDLTYSGTVNKVALGTGATTPSNSDTQLGTEVYRNNAASLTSAVNIGYISGFFTAAEVSGSFAEVGLFIDGAAGANTGALFSRALSTINKSAIQTLTLDWIVTLT